MITKDTKFLVLDTETTNTIDDPFCYDVGFAVVDAAGNVYETHSYVIADIFLDSELMTYAYFAEKVPQYWEDIKSGKRTLRRFKTVKYILRDVVKPAFIHIFPYSKRQGTVAATMSNQVPEEIKKALSVYNLPTYFDVTAKDITINILNLGVLNNSSMNTLLPTNVAISIKPVKMFIKSSPPCGIGTINPRNPFVKNVKPRLTIWLFACVRSATG